MPAGMVHALDTRNGKTVWTYATGNKIFSAPFITSQLAIVSSCDGFIYALDKQKGTVCWKYDTGYPIVACPTVTDGNIYIGSSNGKFYSLRLADGIPNWITDGLNGYIESRPATDSERGEPCYMTWTGRAGKRYGNSIPDAEDISPRVPAGR